MNVRMFSIDGGHTGDIVYHDLTLLNCVLRDGGLLFMDDFSHSYWPGVQDGVGRFFNLHPAHRLVPLALIANKLIITTASHYANYRKALMEALQAIGIKNFGQHMTKHLLHDSPILVFDRKAMTHEQKTALRKRWYQLWGEAMGA